MKCNDNIIAFHSHQGTDTDPDPSWNKSFEDIFSKLEKSKFTSSYYLATICYKG
jgi:hypothetical protein